jgi:predicted ATPase with chaperone activity
VQTAEINEGADLWLQTFLSDEKFCPTEPRTLEQTGLSLPAVESLICKHLAVSGTASGRAIAESICLPFRILEEIYGMLRTRQVVVYSGTAPFNDYYYMLTDQGQQRAKTYQAACAYSGPAPVPFRDYVIAVEAQCISTESPTYEELANACAEISVDDQLFDTIGPAVNSGAGMFLYGHPGNGKSTLAKSITSCFGQDVWIPRVIAEDGHLVKLFDPSCHHEVVQEDRGILKGRDYDRRWVRIRRPTVSVGGELTMDNLEIRHDPVSHVSEAPLQLKSNCGCLLIDDFGRQRIEPAELLNRWIVPLESKYDFLTLPSGKKIQVPFEQLIIFSTNLEPRDLVDEAFLRRIPYKIELADPAEDEFFGLFAMYAERLGCEYRPEIVTGLLDRHYRPAGRGLRRCHPRDLLKQVQNYCKYKRIPFEMRHEHFDRVAASYFAMVFGKTQE